MSHWPPQVNELPDELKRIQNKERDLRWLWHHLLQQGAPLPPEETVPASERPGVISNVINTHTNPPAEIERIKAAHADSLVDEDHLKWLDKDDDRLLIWMLGRIQHLHFYGHGYTIAVPSTAPEARRDAIILTLDLWNTTADEKKRFLADERANWGALRTPETDTQWIKLKDGTQLRWAWEYLHKMFKALPLPPPVNNRDLHTSVLASLDHMAYNHPAERKLFIEKMKKTWSQKKYRDSGKAKKPYYMQLTKDTRTKLEELAKSRDMTAPDLVEILVQGEYDRISAPQEDSAEEPTTGA